jgi:uncharacterized protein YeaO (DUF488 family)
LRKWYDHDPERWLEFRTRYFDELDSQPAAVMRLLEHLKPPVVTLLFGTRERAHNNAAVLKDYLLAKLSL